MVTTSDSTNIVTQPKHGQDAHRSLKRWLKHFFYFQSTKQYFSKQDQYAIATAVEQAEHGHIGEIQVVIEGSIPSQMAYRYDTKMRAQQLFAELGVWDTEYNSGVLLYLNLCDRKVEIVFDRGLKQATKQEVWEEISLNIVECLKSKLFRQGVILGVEKIGNLLDVYYGNKFADYENELKNTPIILG
jgi:uncharacterized membrane protein